ncbi:MAG: hypothetical protein U1D30_13915 [Planctomycetota bacterium]
MADVFGAALAISGNRIAISATGDDDIAVDSSRFMSSKKRLSWSQIAKLKPSDPTASTSFGSGLDIREIPLLPVSRATRKARVYLPASWIPVGHEAAHSLIPSPGCGSQLTVPAGTSISGQAIFVSSYGENSSQGTVYAYDLSGTMFSPGDVTGEADLKISD